MRAVTLLVGVFALAGIPPFVGFMAKVGLLTAAFARGHTILVVITMVNAAIAIYYYLRVIRETFFGEAADDATPIRLSPATTALCLVLIGLITALGVFPAAVVDAISGALGYMETGELHALATTSAERSSITPDVPAANETLEGFDARSFIGLFGPGGLPQDVRDRLHEASAVALEDPAVAERARTLSMDVVGLGPDEFGALIVRDTEKWRNIMIDAGILEAE